MLKMTKLTDYGIVLLMQLASRREDAVFNARDAASATHLPLPMVSKILKALAKGGVLTSERGVKGGYRLARPADEISIAEVIAVLEGPIALTECIGVSDSKCEIELLCPARSNWHRINEAVRQALAGISLADMARPLPRHRAAISTISTLGPIAGV